MRMDRQKLREARRCLQVLPGVCRDTETRCTCHAEGDTGNITYLRAVAGNGKEHPLRAQIYKKESVLSAAASDRMRIVGFCIQNQISLNWQAAPSANVKTSSKLWEREFTPRWNRQWNHAASSPAAAIAFVPRWTCLLLQSRRGTANAACLEELNVTEDSYSKATAVLRVIYGMQERFWCVMLQGERKAGPGSWTKRNLLIQFPSLSEFDWNSQLSGCV